MGIPAVEIDVRYKLTKICGETGGTVYNVDQASDLQRVYDQIRT